MCIEPFGVCRRVTRTSGYMSPLIDPFLGINFDLNLGVALRSTSVRSQTYAKESAFAKFTDRKSAKAMALKFTGILDCL